MRQSAAFLAVAAFLAGAAPALAAPPEVSVEQPSGRVRGSVEVRAVATGASDAAFHVRKKGSWAHADSVALAQGPGGRFEGSWNTASVTNGVYEMEVRAWADGYRAGDPATFGRQVIRVSVQNPPPAPRRLYGTTGLTSAQVGWKAVPTQERSDFAGYRVLRRRSPSCDGVTGYRRLAEVRGAPFVDRTSRPGTYCFRVRALRTGPSGGIVASAPSPPVRVVVRGAGDATAAPRRPRAPEVPRLGGGTRIISDGEFKQRLPYGEATVIQEVDPEILGEASVPEEAPRPGYAGLLLAAGIVLFAGGIGLRRLLSSAPRDVGRRADLP